MVRKIVQTSPYMQTQHLIFCKITHNNYKVSIIQPQRLGTLRYIRIDLLSVIFAMFCVHGTNQIGVHNILLQF